MDSKKLEEATCEERSCQITYPSDDSDDGRNRYIDSPSRDTESLMLDDAALPTIQFLSLPPQIAQYLENGSPFLPNFSSLHSFLKAEEITDDFPTFKNSL